MEQIRRYVDAAFRNVMVTREVLDLKEELIGNLSEQYQDFLSQGLGEQEAYRRAVEGVGDLSELVDMVSVKERGVSPKEEQNRAVFVALGVLLLILAPGCLLLFLLLFHSIGLGLFTMFVCFGGSAGLFAYAALTRPRGMAKYAEQKRFEALEKLSGAASFSSVQAMVSRSQKDRALLVSLELGYWLCVLGLYLLLSFLLGIWAYSWLLFVLALAVEQIARAAVQLKGGKTQDRDE